MADEVAADGRSQSQLGLTESEGSVHLLCYSFNQDYSCFVCGTTSGFRVYTTSPVCEVRRRSIPEKSQPSQGYLASDKLQSAPTSVGLVRMLFKTTIFPMATGPINAVDGPNKIQIWDDQKTQFMAVLRSKYAVKGVAVQRDVIAMVCEYAVYIYRADKLTILLYLTTAQNDRGLCAMAAAGKPWVLACPGQATGTIRVQVGQDDRNSCIIEAHRSALAGLSVNASGSLIASASEHGTVVKVFSATGELVHQLRRSVRPATVTSLAFRADDRFLAVASSSSTVHIFRIDADGLAEDKGQGGRHEEDAAQSPAGAQSPQLTGAGESVGAFMGAVPSYFVEPKSIAMFRIPDTDATGQPAVDVRSSASTILGPQVGFRGVDACFLVLHCNGVLYEVGFSEDAEAGAGRQECTYQAATTWFAVRSDFKMTNPCARVPTAAGGATEDDEGAEDWQLL